MKEENRDRAQLALSAVLAVAAYHLSVVGILFLVPLQWVKFRQGERSFLLASISTAVGIAAVEAVVKSLRHSPWTGLDTAMLGLPFLLIAGWVAIVLMERLGWRFLYRLLAVTAVTGLVLFPLIASLLRQEVFVRALEVSFGEVWKQMFETSGMDASGLMGQLDRSEFFDLLKKTFLASFLLLFFLFWGATAWVTRLFAPVEERSTLKDFFVPSQGAWILLGLWAVILVQGLLARNGMEWEWGIAQYAMLNVAWVALIVHALAGWGIVHSLMDRWHWPRFSQGVVRVLLIFFLMVPGNGQIVVLAGLPILAVLELWVNFRKRTQGVGL